MVQTEINLALQSAGSPPVTWLLDGVTLLGYTPVYVVLLVTLAFAVRLRPGLAVVGGLVLAGLVTDAAKSAVAFPRPDEVDPRVAMSASARRAKRVLVALALFTVAFAGTEGLARLFGGPGRMAALPSSVVVATATLAGTAAACRRLGLYAPRP